jgi:hypothetical protein
MGWYYKDPLAFPAIFTRGLVQAAASPGEPHLLYHASSHSDAAGKAEQLRWFKWCCAQPPLNHPTAFELLEGFKFRTSIKASPHLPGNPFCLWLTAQPKLIPDFAALNPHLADLIPE